MKFNKRTGFPASILKFLVRYKINPSRVYLKQFIKQAAESLEPGGLVLDAGSGHSPYRDFFAHARYQATDFCKVEGSPYAKIDYVCDLASIPVDNNRYDLIICTQVLEHINDPQIILRELYRSLKPGRELWISAPLYFNEHQIPYDFYRFTQFGFKYQLQQAGFQIKRLEHLEGYYATLAYQLQMAATDLPLTPNLYGGGTIGISASLFALFLKPFFFLISLLFSRLDLRYKNIVSGHSKNYAIVALKPYLS